MKKIQNLGKSLGKNEQKGILGGAGGTRWCNCYTNDPQQGVEKTCSCNSTISQCCGASYTAMNCGVCSS